MSGPGVPPVAVTVTSADAAMLVAIVVLILVSVALAVAETALTRMTRVKAAALVEEGRRGAPALAALVESTERWLNPLLLVILAVQLVQATLTGVVAERLLGGLGVAVATVVNVGVVFVVAEAAPKTWAIQHTDRASLLAARPVAALAAFLPLRLISRALIGLTNVLLPGKGLKEGPFVSEEELLAVAEAAVEGSSIEEGERQLIESILEFGDTVVREVMVPRPDMITIASTFRVADAMEVVLLNGYSRIPVTGEGIDDIVGIAYAKDLMRAERDGGDEGEIGGLVRTARFVPETKPVHALLKEMQAESFHMAVVVDEYGGTAGIVTLEDLIEELVGEIVDEYDREEPMVEPRPDGAVAVNGRISVDELNEVLHAQLPEGDWDSVAGLVLDALGRVPEVGEEVEVAGWVLQAERLQGRRISRVVVRRAASGPSDPVGEHDAATAP